MKKIITLCAIVIYTIAYSQSLPLSETSTLDDKLINIDKSSVTSGILYQRSATYTNLFDYNKATDFNTANVSFFEQSLNDLFYGSNQIKFIKYEDLRSRIVANKYLDNIVDIGIINTPFHILNYNEDNPNAGGLLFNTSSYLFSQISGQPPFFALQTTVIAPLKKETKGTSITFNFRSDLYFVNGSKTIKTLTTNLGDGIVRNIITNGVFSPQNIIVNYTSTGDKTLTFNIVYSDNTTLTTYGIFYFKYESITGKISSTSMCNGETLADDYSITSDTEFKGYDEPFAFKGKFDYRVFYRTGGIDRKIRKPIIIIDGFDPGDKRKIFSCEMINYKQGETFSIQDMMTYSYVENGTTKYTDLIQQLRGKGFDVTIVNHPTYSVSNIAPYNIVPNGTSNSREINGGADYIERNGLILATLIKNFNAQLNTNGSTEKLVIVGPSMGGQTSRYALAYLEKLGINHNTRLWISVDSPHLGANIPLGDQALINLAKTVGKSTAAADFYDNQLGSPAAKQQLIEYHRDNPDHHRVNYTNLNGRTISQGFVSNSGNSFYQQFYNSQFSNGIPNSKGYPMNLRKIALVNGSLTGKIFGNDNEMVINLRGFKKTQIFLPIGSWTFTTLIASLESYYMPTLNSGEIRIARLKKGFDDRTTIASNINSRGNMDAVPGGWYPAQLDIVRPLLGHSPVDGVRGSFWQFTGDNLGYFLVNNFGGGYWDLRDFKFNHAFIPTFFSTWHQKSR